MSEDIYSSDPTRRSANSGRNREVKFGSTPESRTKSTPSTFGPQASPYLTREDINVILIEARKVESFVYIDIRPPYPEEMAIKPCPTNYTPPIFPKFEGVARNAREHIRRYVDSLAAHFHDHEPRLREFSKPPEGWAFAWYTSLSPGSVLNCNVLKWLEFRRWWINI